jgi:hypothetical protein
LPWRFAPLSFWAGCTTCSTHTLGKPSVPTARVRLQPQEILVQERQQPADLLTTQDRSQLLGADKSVAQRLAPSGATANPAPTRHSCASNRTVSLSPAAQGLRQKGTSSGNL